MRTTEIKHKISVIAYAALWVFSFVIAANYNTLDSGSFFFLICSGVSALYLSRHYDIGGIGYRIILLLIAVYFSFAIFGRDIFMQQGRFDFSLLHIIHCAVLAIAIYPLTPGIIAIFEKASQREHQDIRPSKKGILKAGLSCGLIVFVISFILTIGYYPCTMTNDSAGHWQQATGAVAMSDYSPIAFNLLLKGLFAITGYTTPYIFVLFQTVVLSLIVGDITAFLHRRGVNLKSLIIGSLIFAILPSTYMLLLYLSKNPLTGILCLGMVATLLQVTVEPEYYLARPVWYIKIIILITSLYLVRENNVVIAFPLIGFAVWFFFKHKKIGRRILIIVCGVACSIFLMTGVVYRTIEYEHVVKSHETIRPLVTPIGSAIKQELPLPDDLLSTATRVLPAEEWTKRYNPFNSDPVTWGNPRPQYSEVSLKEGFSVYLKMLRLYPGVVIKDRLDGMDCVWNIRSNIFRCPYQLEGDVSFKETTLPEGIVRNAAGGIKELSESFLDISASEPVLDIFIWKNGIYIYLLVVTAVALARKKKTKLLWAVLPSCFILFTYMLVIAWQMYFYLWFFPLSVVMLMIVAMVECRKRNAIVNVWSSKKA